MARAVPERLDRREWAARELGPRARRQVDDRGSPARRGPTPVVCGDRIFLTSTDAQNHNLYALCLNRADGRVLWSKTIQGKGRQAPYNKDASPSPVSDGARTIFLFGQGTFFAVDNGGTMLWRRELEKEIGPLTISFLYSASPLLYRKRLYVPMIRDNSTSNTDNNEPNPVDNLESCLLCVDPVTGKDIWKQPRVNEEYTVENRDSYATPVPWEATFGTSATTAIVTVGGNFLTGHDWLSGRELWRLRYGKTGRLPPAGGADAAGHGRVRRGLQAAAGGALRRASWGGRTDHRLGGLAIHGDLDRHAVAAALPRAHL